MGFFDWRLKSAGKGADEILAEARSLAVEGRYRDALSTYSRLRRRDRPPAVLVEMARAHLTDGNDSGALSCASDALDLDPQCAPAMCVQGEVLLHERRSSEALARFREALRLDANCDTARRRIEELAPARATFEPGPSIRPSFDESMVRNQLAGIGNEALRLHAEGRYEEAVTHAENAVQFALGNLGPDHPDYATSLNNLAGMLQATNRLSEAEPLYRRALRLTEAAFGPDHPSVATRLDNLAELLRDTNRPSEAEPLYRRALAIFEAALGPDHPDVATCLNNLAALLRDTNRLSEAETLIRRALAIWETGLGHDHPDITPALNILALLLRATNRLSEAEPLYRRALAITEAGLGPDHPTVATRLNNLAELLRATNRLSEAEPLYRRALAIDERSYGPDHPEVAIHLNSLAALLHDSNRLSESESLYRRALAVLEAGLGPDHPTVAAGLNNLAGLLRDTNRLSEAEPLYRRALAVTEAGLGPDHPDVAIRLNGLAGLLRDTNRPPEAEPLLRRALAITEAGLGPDHPDVAICLSGLASLLHATNRPSEAEPLFRRALAVLEAGLGPDHPDVAGCLNNLAWLLHVTNRLSEAESMYRRALAVLEAGLGPDHPDATTCLNNLAALCVQTVRAAEALRLMKQAATGDDRMIGQVFTIVSEAQRTEYLDPIRGKLNAFLSLVWLHLSESTGAVRDALDLVLRRKALGAEALAVQRDAVLGGKYPHLQVKLNELTTLARRIARMTLAGPGPEGVRAHQQQLTEWNSRKERLEGDLARQVPEMNLERQLRAADRRAVALGLREGVSLVEFVRFDVFNFHAVSARGEPRWQSARYLAFVLPAGAPDDVRMIDLGEAEPIDWMIADFRAGITGEADGRAGRDLGASAPEPSRSSGRGEGEALRAAVFDPVREALGGRTRLFLAPDGDLARLPFEVLPTAGGRYLIDEFAISYLGTGRDVLRFGAEVSGEPTAPVVAADPDFDLGGDGPPALADAGLASGVRSRDLARGELRFNRLPATSVEGEQVAAMLGVSPWTGRDALEQRLKGCRSPRILHLATHGHFLPDQPRDLNAERLGPGAAGWLTGEGPGRLSGPPPENPLLRSMLALAGANTWLRNGVPPEEAEDGLLTAEDVTGLDLLATELVVLSACETGLGQVRVGEGVFGLRRSFVVAGAKTLVMSLWKVPDLATALLMGRLYENLLARRLPRDVALREAQTFLRGLAVGQVRDRWLTPALIARLSAGDAAVRRELERLARRPDDHHPFTHPLYWGAFICQGDPSPLRGPSPAGVSGTGSDRSDGPLPTGKF